MVGPVHTGAETGFGFCAALDGADIRLQIFEDMFSMAVRSLSVTLGHWDKGPYFQAALVNTRERVL